MSGFEVSIYNVKLSKNEA